MREFTFAGMTVALPVMRSIVRMIRPPSARLLTMGWLIAVSGAGCAHGSRHPTLRFEAGPSVTIPYQDDWDRRPIVEASLNGVRGKFLVDTGADGPLLTMSAVQRCGIPLSKASISAGFLGDDGAGRFKRVAGKVTIELGPVIITWGNAAVTSGLGSEKWFGVIDYRTLKAAHAIINTQERSITLSQ